jgi:hypothetical protein
MAGWAPEDSLQFFLLGPVPKPAMDEKPGNKIEGMKEQGTQRFAE